MKVNNNQTTETNSIDLVFALNTPGPYHHQQICNLFKTSFPVILKTFLNLSVIFFQAKLLSEVRGPVHSRMASSKFWQTMAICRYALLGIPLLGLPLFFTGIHHLLRTNPADVSGRQSSSQKLFYEYHLNSL